MQGLFFAELRTPKAFCLAQLWRKHWYAARDGCWSHRRGAGFGPGQMEPSQCTRGRPSGRAASGGSANSRRGHIQHRRRAEKARSRRSPTHHGTKSRAPLEIRRPTRRTARRPGPNGKTNPLASRLGRSAHSPHARAAAPRCKTDATAGRGRRKRGPVLRDRRSRAAGVSREVT